MYNASFFISRSNDGEFYLGFAKWKYMDLKLAKLAKRNPNPNKLTCPIAVQEDPLALPQIDHCPADPACYKFGPIGAHGSDEWKNDADKWKCWIVV